MNTITLELPDAVELNEQEAKMILAGYSKRTFMELLGQYGVSVFNFPTSELAKDIANAQSHHI